MSVNVPQCPHRRETQACAAPPEREPHLQRLHLSPSPVPTLSRIPGGRLGQRPWTLTPVRLWATISVCIAPTRLAGTVATPPGLSIFPSRA